MAASSYSFVFLLLAIVLILIKVTQFISQKYNLPKVAGEILLGILLGPTFLTLLALDGSHSSIFSSLFSLATVNEINLSIDIILFIAEIAILLLLFEVGLEMDIRSLKRSGRSAMLTAIGGIILPFLGGFVLIIMIAPLPNIIPLDIPIINVALFFAATLTATSIGISISIFIELDKLDSQAAKTMIGAAVIDDILAILLLTGVITFIEEEAALGIEAIIDVIVIFFQILGFFIISFIFGIFVLPKIINKISGLRDRYLPITLGLVMLFFFSWFASLMHLAPIIGAFVAGVLLNPFKHEISEKILEQLGPFASWVVPIFFISVGLRINLIEIISLEVLLIASGLIIVAVLTKVLGSGIGAYLGKSSLSESYTIGVAMSARGEIILIFASVALELGIFSSLIYSSLVLLVVFTSLFVPVLLKYSFRTLEKEFVT